MSSEYSFIVWPGIHVMHDTVLDFTRQKTIVAIGALG
jgi:hypothetical protein